MIGSLPGRPTEPRAPRRAGRFVDPGWWWSGVLDGRPMREILRRRDIGAVFHFLRARGWSRAAIAAAAGLSETRVRAICQGKQKVTSYEVLERIAEGLGIERGLLGLAYVDDMAAVQGPEGERSLPGLAYGEDVAPNGNNEHRAPDYPGRRRTSAGSHEPFAAGVQAGRQPADRRDRHISLWQEAV